jgi:hypothetical protein
VSESLVRFIPRLIRHAYSVRGFASLIAALFVSVLPAAAFAIPSVTTLSITPSTTVNAGTVVTMTANVSDGSPVRGQVDFCLATATYCTGSAVIATVQTTMLGNAVYRSVPGAGAYSIKAVFHGTNTVAGSSSAAQTLTVNGIGSYATATSIASSGNPGNYTLTATVAGFGKLPSSGPVDFLNTSAANTQIGSRAKPQLSPLPAMQVTRPRRPWSQAEAWATILSPPRSRASASRPQQAMSHSSTPPTRTRT